MSLRISSGCQHSNWMSSPHKPVQPEPKKRKACPTATAFLDPGLWKFLPDDLLEKVAAFMPFPGLFRCRAVNKRLKDFVFSEKFQEARACVQSWNALSPTSQYLLIFATIEGKNMCTAFDAVANRWLCMPPMRGLDPRAKDCIAGEELFFYLLFIPVLRFLFFDILGTIISVDLQYVEASCCHQKLNPVFCICVWRCFNISFNFIWFSFFPCSVPLTVLIKPSPCIPFNQFI